MVTFIQDSMYIYRLSWLFSFLSSLFFQDKFNILHEKAVEEKG